jgi:hypothetical protein
VTIRLIPAPRGAGIVAARTPKKVLQMAGIEDCYTGEGMITAVMCMPTSVDGYWHAFTSAVHPLWLWLAEMSLVHFHSQHALHCLQHDRPNCMTCPWIRNNQHGLHSSCSYPSACAALWCMRCAASRGSRKTLGNFVKATFYALSHTYGFLSPDLWAETKYTKSPLQEFTDFLAKPAVAAAPKVDYEAAY